MNKFFNVIQWIIGIFILVCSVGAFIMSIPAGICLIVCAFVVLPPVWSVFKAKGTYNNVMRTVRIILAVVLFAVAMLLTPELSVNRNNHGQIFEKKLIDDGSAYEGYTYYII